MLIFVLPPLFVSSSDGAAIDFSKFNPFAAINLSLAIFLYLQDKTEQKRAEKSFVMKIAACSGIFFWAFGGLVLCAAVFELIGMFLKTKVAGNVILPSNFLQGLCCLFSLCSSAFYEECLYRLYLPKALKSLLRGEESRMALFCFAEAAAILLFAASHRYQGLLAVLNALICAVILRAAFVQSKSVWPTFLAHLCYNASALFFSTLVP